MKFKQKINLISHKNSVHLKIKEFECCYSGFHKRFSKRDHLNLHSRVHSGEKPFVSNYKRCEKYFKMNTYLKVHNNRHLNI